MITVKQVTEALFVGDKNCKGHAFVTKDRGKISLKDLSHTQEKACYLCGRHEKVVTQIVKYNPFTFDAVIARIQK